MRNKKIKTICISCSLALTMMLTACGSGKPSVPGTTGNNPATIISTEELSKKELDKINERIEKVGKSYDGLYDYNYGYDLFGAKGMNSGSVVYEMTEAACDEESDAAPTSGATYSGEKALTDMPAEIIVNEPVDWNREGYNSVTESGFITTAANRFSTFGADVDTATYSNLRRTLYETYGTGINNDEYAPYYPGGGLDKDAVRLEEMINYFNYSYPKAENGEKFAVDQTIVKCPWNEDTLLYRVGVRAEEIAPAGGSNIVFLIDTSGSMFDNNKLPLAQKSFKILLESLTENDRISIVTYAGSSAVLLEGVSGADHGSISEAIDSLQAGGGTNGAQGINTAYEIAKKYFIEGGNNRVILATDGDLNIGISSEAGLINLIEEKKDSGIFFSALGFGEGNYMDDKMEALADHGNGNYAYIDCVMEAEKVLKDEIWSTLYTVAKDTKFQVEFNPETVAAYRLIGYENRKMAAEDFSNDKKDGGEVGSGQTVTILYEIVPSDSAYVEKLGNVQSRYETTEEKTSDDMASSADASTDASASSDKEYCALNIRYKNPDADESILRTYPVMMNMVTEEIDADTSWAAGVAQAGMLFRDSEYKGTSTYAEVIERLKKDPDIMNDDLKAQFIYMVEMLSK